MKTDTSKYDYENKDADVSLSFSLTGAVRKAAFLELLKQAVKELGEELEAK